MISPRSGGSRAIPIRKLPQRHGPAVRRPVPSPPYDRDSGYGYTGLAANWPILEVRDLDKEVVVTARVPGLTAKDVELFFDKGMLTLRGEKKGEKDAFGYSELFYRKFERQISLPYRVDPQKCIAEFGDGLLTIHLPKLTQVENNKKIPVQVETRH